MSLPGTSRQSRRGSRGPRSKARGLSALRRSAISLIEPCHALSRLKYTNGNFKAYANFSYNITEGIDPESNQYLIDRQDCNYLLTYWHYTYDMQRMTGSAGASYRWNDTLFTTRLMYGSGLRSGDLAGGQRRCAQLAACTAICRGERGRGA
jgi:integrase